MNNLDYFKNSNELQIKSIFDNLIEGVFIFQDGIFQYVNKSLAELVFCSVENLIGLSFYKFINSIDFVFKAKSEYPKRNNNSEIESFEIEILKNKKRKYICQYGFEILMNGRIAKMGILLDITKLIDIENALKESKNLYKLVAESTNDIIWIKDLDLKTLYVSPSVSRQLGYSVEEYSLLTPEELLPSESYESYKSIRRSLEKEIKEGSINFRNNSFRYEMLFKHKNGKKFWGEINLTVLFDDRGVAFAVHGVTRNINERKQAQLAVEKLNNALADKIIENNAHLEEALESLQKEKEKSEEASKFKSIIIANLSHEFRTPLNSILLSANSIENKTESDEIKKLAENIQLSADKLYTALTLMIKLAEIESSRDELCLENASLYSLIKDCMFYYEKKARDKELSFIFESLNNAKINTDVELLSHALGEIIDNAIKFTKKGGIKIELDVVDVDNRKFACIKIIDTGIGIKGNKIKSLFEPFSQISAGNERKYDGLGIGLALVKKIITLLNAEIIINSKFGIGTTIELYFNILE